MVEFLNRAESTKLYPFVMAMGNAQHIIAILCHHQWTSPRTKHTACSCWCMLQSILCVWHQLPQAVCFYLGVFAACYHPKGGQGIFCNSVSPHVLVCWRVTIIPPPPLSFWFCKYQCQFYCVHTVKYNFAICEFHFNFITIK